METLEERMKLTASLHSLTLNAPIDAMTLFRTHTVGDFPFVEAYLSDCVD